MDSMRRFVESARSAARRNNRAKAMKWLARFFGFEFNYRFEPVEAGLIYAPPREAVREFISKLDGRYKTYAKLLVATGIRPEALTRLKPEDLDVRRGVLRASRLSNRTKRYRDNPIPPELVPDVLEMLERGVTKNGWRKAVERAVRRGAPRISREELRNFFYTEATRLVPENVVRWLMGHRLGTAEHYFATRKAGEIRRYWAEISDILSL